MVYRETTARLRHTIGRRRRRPPCTSIRSLPSEIRFVRPRYFGVLSRIPLDVFGANLLHPVGGAKSISHGRGPRRREDPFILDSELELQVLASMVRVPHPLSDDTLLGVPFETLFRGFVINQPIAFDHVQ